MPDTLSKRDSVVNRKLNKRDNNYFGWNRAIEDAEKHIARLTSAVGMFKKRRDSGEPWPGEVAGTEKDSIPA